MSSFFTSEHPDNGEDVNGDDLNSDVNIYQLPVPNFFEVLNVLLELTPDDAEARYTSVEGWSNLTQEAQNALKLRYTDPAKWNEPIQFTSDSDIYATYVC